jgi:hypothetical protein
MEIRERFVVDADGNRVQVLLDIADYERLLEALEDLEDLRVYDEVKAAKEEMIPLEQAIREIEEDYKA